MRSAAEANAPNGLMVYWSIDASPLMGLAGHRTKAVEYLLGTHVTAESMLRYNPRALLYAPLRVLVHADSADNAVFSIDRPSAVFGSLGIGAITAVGQELDRKVAALLAVIGVDASRRVRHPLKRRNGPQVQRVQPRSSPGGAPKSPRMLSVAGAFASRRRSATG